MSALQSRLAATLAAIDAANAEDPRKSRRLTAMWRSKRFTRSA